MEKNAIYLQTNTNLKMQLLNIANQIEESINQAKQSNDLIINKDIEDNELNESKSFLNKLNVYKRQIHELQKIIDNTASFRELDNKENQIKYQSKQLKELRIEYDTAMKLLKNQQKSVNELDNELNAKNEINIYKQKLSSMKEELKLIKEKNAEYLSNIKLQNKNIMILRDQIRLINDNIKEKKNDSSSTTYENNIKQEKQLNNKISEYKKKNSEKINNYEKEIKKQEKKINNLDQDIDILKAKIKHKNKQIYIVDERIKQIQKYQLQLNNQNSPKYNHNDTISIKHSSSNSTLNKNSTKDRKPPFIIKSFNNNNKTNNNSIINNNKNYSIKAKPDFISPEKIKINEELKQLSIFIIFNIFRK